MQILTRSEVAQITETGFDAIRYYERIGLLPTPVRGSNKYRQYDETTVERLRFIKQAKKCGFTLSQIKDSLELLHSTGACDKSTDEIIDVKISELDERIIEITKMKEMLKAVKEPLRNMECQKILEFDIGNIAIPK